MAFVSAGRSTDRGVWSAASSTRSDEPTAAANTAWDAETPPRARIRAVSKRLDIRLGARQLESASGGPDLTPALAKFR